MVVECAMPDMIMNQRRHSILNDSWRTRTGAWIPEQTIF